MEWNAYYERAVLRRCGGEQSELRENLKKSLADGRVTLLLGAGITAPLVGNWQELLNELAVMRCGSHEFYAEEQHYGRPTLNQLRLYIEEKMEKGMFLPGDTNVLEQGEYLMFDRNDPEARNIDERGGSSEAWRENFFAAQVKHAIHLLTQRHLKMNVGESYKALVDDFRKWILDEDAIFSIGRKTLSDKAALRKALEMRRPEELLCELNRRYHLGLDWDALRALLNEDSMEYKEKIQALSRCFGMLPSEVRSVLDENVKRGELVKIICAGGTAEEKLEQIDQQLSVDSDAVIRELLINKAVNEFSRPNYSTLAAVLKLCVTGGIQNVVVYNFDTIFDRLLADLEIQKLLGATSHLQVRIYSFHDEKAVELKGINDDLGLENTVHIYHVHGIVDDELDTVSPIIFSENSYRSYQRRTINWSNIRIADIMSTANLLCVGFSGTDSNFRHLVRLYKTLKDSPVFASRESYSIYLTRSCHADVERYAPNAEDLNELERECAYRCLNTYFDLVQAYYKKQLNVRLLWTENFDEMAAELERLADSLPKSRSVKF